MVRNVVFLIVRYLLPFGLGQNYPPILSSDVRLNVGLSRGFFSLCLKGRPPKVKVSYLVP